MRGNGVLFQVFHASTGLAVDKRPGSGTKKSREAEREWFQPAICETGESKRTGRGERRDGKALPKAARRQLAQRCVRPIFSFPHAHLQLKQLLEHLHTKRLQHCCSADKSKKQQPCHRKFLAQVFLL